MNQAPHRTSFEKMLDRLDRGERAFLAGHRDGWHGRDLDEDSEDADRYWDGYGHGTRNGRRGRGEPATIAVVQITIAAPQPGGEIVLFRDELAREIYANDQKIFNRTTRQMRRIMDAAHEQSQR